MKYKLNNEWKELSHPLIVGGGSAEQEYVESTFKTVPAELRRNLQLKYSSYAYSQSSSWTFSFLKPTERVYYINVSNTVGTSSRTFYVDGHEITHSNNALNYSSGQDYYEIPIGSTEIQLDLTYYISSSQNLVNLSVSETHLEPTNASNNSNYTTNVLKLPSINWVELLVDGVIRVTANSSYASLASETQVNLPEYIDVESQGYLRIGDTTIYDSDGGKY